MKTYRRTVTPEKAAEIRARFEKCGEYAHIKQFGENRVPRGRYSMKIVIQSWRGGNEWSPKRLVPQFVVYI